MTGSVTLREEHKLGWNKVLRRTFGAKTGDLTKGQSNECD